MSTIALKYTARNRLRLLAKLLDDQQQKNWALNEAVKQFTTVASSSAVSTAATTDSLRRISPPSAGRRRPLSMKEPISAVSFHSSTTLQEEKSADASGVGDESSPDGAEAVAEASEAGAEVAEIQYAFTPPAPLSESSKLKVKNIFDKFVWLDLIEVHMLTELINEKMGVKPGDAAAAGGAFMDPSNAAAGAQSGAEDESAAENALKDVKLVGFDAKSKIKVIKEVRSIGGLGLKEAKEMVEAAPKVVQKGLKPDKAEEIKAQLEAVGAQVELV